MERVGALVAELRRRKVLRGAALYLVVAWAVIEVSATVLPLLFVPEWVVRAITVLAVAGFPVALVLAWAFDLTPDGLQRAPVPDGPRGPSRRARVALASLTVAATAMAGAAAWALWLSPRAEASRPAALSPTRVAVLYFDDHSASGRLGYMANGLTEALIHELSQIEPLEVISRNGVKPYRNPTIPLDSIARILGAGSIVEGSVEGDEDRLVATVQLIDGRTGAHLMSRRLERAGGDPLALRDAIVAEGAGLLSRALGRELEVARTRAETANPEAWDLTERARTLIDHADTLRWKLGDVEGARRILVRADSLLERAETRARDWPRPTIVRAEVAGALARITSSTRQAQNPELLRRGIRHLDRVLDRLPTDADALARRGGLRYQLSWVTGQQGADTLVAAAEADLLRAVEANPGSAIGWVGLAELLRSRGDFANASVAAERALAADPFLIHAESSILFTLAHVWLELGDMERAERWAAQGRRRYPAEYAFAAERLVIMAGWPDADVDIDSAWAMVRAVERGAGIDRWPHGELQAAAILARADRPDSARSVVAAVRESGGTDPWLDYYEANVRLQLGERDRAIDLLARFLDAMPHRRSYIAEDWWWRPLRSASRFRELVGDS